MFYAICGCDNCYVSCERVFRPDLSGKSVVVLSNSSGYVVARSEEAKQMGIKAGSPYYQMEEQFPGEEVAVFPSNYELYGELTARVMTIIKDAAPQMFRYSADECFCLLPDMSSDELRQWGEDLHRRILKHTGLPVSIGAAKTKTLAKAASHFAKEHEGCHHCCIIDTKEKRIKALQLLPVGEVRGIGHRDTPKLLEMGDRTAYDFASHSKEWVRLLFHVTGVRAWMELNGEDCTPNEEPAKKKSICTNRSFTGTISDSEAVRTHASNFAVCCSQKLKRQHSVASVVNIFIHTSQFKEDQQQYWNSREVVFSTPSNSVQQIMQAAAKALQEIFVSGLQYKKAGVIVMGIMSGSIVQTNFIDYNRDKMEKQMRLDQVIDRLNKLDGSELVVLGAQQYREKDKQGHHVAFTDAIRHDFRSKNPTTRRSDIVTLK